MAGISDQIKEQFRVGGMYLKLIYINAAVFVIFGLLSVIVELMKSSGVVDFMLVNSGASTNILELVCHPWTILTYMFVQVEFFHLFSNMLMLFFIGRMLEAYLGAKKILSIYLLGGLAGLALQIFAKHSFPLFAEMPDIFVIGASGAVFALSTALITYNPNLEVNFFGIFPIKLVWVIGLYFLLEVLQVSKISGVAHFTHVGGGLFGFIAMSQYKKGKDMLKWLDSFQGTISGLFIKKPKMKVKYSKFRESATAQSKPPRDDYDFNASKVEQQKKLDEILEKIKFKGYEGLTKAEKDFLNRY